MYREKSSVVFVFALLQDVNILWPLVRLAQEETSYPILFLVADAFRERDKDGRWAAELTSLQVGSGAELHQFGSSLAAVDILRNRTGIIFAGSESSLNPHRVTHELFRSVPAGFTRVTLQHGFECAGFHQNREQSLAFGERVQFAADIICSWTSRERLTHTLRSDLGKVLVTGSPARLETSAAAPSAETPIQQGLVCENLHSVRMKAAGDFTQSYMETFTSFARLMAHRGRSVALRPHPGGQYTVRHNVPLPPSMILQNDPIYRLDLSQYAYGISAPSSVLIDMVLAGIPTAVWQDPDGAIDTSSYQGLTMVSSLSEWMGFADAALADPVPFVARQREFLEATGMVTNPDEVRRRFLALIRAGCGGGAGSLSRSTDKRVLFVANGFIPTLEICFLRPLGPLFETGALDPLVIVEGQVRKAMGASLSVEQGRSWFEETLRQHKPEVVVFCRYSGPLAEEMARMAQEQGIAVIYHVDDDLMYVPREIGEPKFREHNSPSRLLSVSTLLASSDLVYCSTPRLMQRIKELGYETELLTGHGHCSGKVYRLPVERPIRTIGYMGFDHAHDLEMILPDLVQLLTDRPELRFELFGTIPIPGALAVFGDRISAVLPVRPYQAFIEKLVGLDWDIGIAPLADTRFNVYKANNKWVEYTSAGAAVIATAGMSYDHCCADGCGVLVENASGWYEAIDRLCEAPEQRVRMVRNAQERLLHEYSDAALRSQVLGVFDRATVLRKGAVAV